MSEVPSSLLLLLSQGKSLGSALIYLPAVAMMVLISWGNLRREREMREKVEKDGGRRKRRG